jgi:hypothetical protein
MNTIAFPIARGEKQSRPGAQHYLDVGFNDLQRQYRHKGEVNSEVTLFLNNDGRLKEPVRYLEPDQNLDQAFKYAEILFKGNGVIGGFAIISTCWRGNQFIYLDARDVRKKALSLFLLDKQTGDPIRDIVLIKQIDGPPGRDRFKYATPSNWLGRATRIPIGALG